MASGDVDATATRIYLSIMEGMVDELRVISARRVKSPAEAEKNLADMRAVLARGRKYTDEQWIGKDLNTVYKSAYFEAGPGLTMDKADIGAGRSHRTAIKKRADVAFNNLDLWAQATAKRQQAGADISRVRALRKDLEAKARKQTGADKLKTLGLIEQAKEAETAVRRGGFSSPHFGSAEDEPTVVYRYQKSRNKRLRRGMISQRQPASVYFEMLSRTGQQEMGSLGYLRAVAKLNQMVLVGDGPECGWSTHEDPVKANGRIVTAEEAMSAARAHPNCRRSFQVLDGKPGSKQYRDSLKKFTGATRKDQIQRIAKATALLGHAAAGVVQAGRNPLVARAVRNIIADSEINLPPAFERVLLRWTGGHSARETAVLAGRGLVADEVDMDDFRARELQQFDEDLANDEFLSKSRLATHKISQDQARLLGTGTTVMKGDLIDRIEDYADYTRFERSRRLSMAENLAEQALEVEVREEVYGEAAIRYYLAQPRMGSMMSTATRSLEVVKKTIESDPRAAGEDIVKALASVITKIPWASARKGPFRFTIGITADGRRAIASEVYNRIADHTSYSKFERDLAARLGMDLPNRTITKQDIVNVFLPRITYFSGKHVSASLGMVRGQIQPIIRAYPSHTYLRWMSLQSSMRTGAINDFIRSQMGDPGTRKSLRAALRDLSDEHLFTVDMFRNGPIRASLRMQGNTLESYALKLRPEQQWLRYNYRFYPRTVRKFMSITDGQSIYRHKRVMFMHHEMIVLPRLRGGVMLTRRQEIRELLMGVLKWKGTAAEAARALGLSYDAFLDALNMIEIDLEKNFAKFMVDVRAYSAAIRRTGGLTSIRTVADLRALSNQYKLVSSKSDVIKRFDGPLPLNMMDTIDPELAAVAHRSFMDDVAAFYREWDVRHPNTPRPRFGMVSGTPDMITYNARTAVIQVDEEVARNWVTYGRIRIKSVDAGWSPPGTRLTVSALFHEGMHHVIATLTHTEYRKVWASVFASRGWAVKVPNLAGLTKDEARKAVTKWIRDPRISKQIALEAGGQALLGANEFLAELYSSGVAGDGPGRPARALLEMLREIAR